MNRTELLALARKCNFSQGISVELAAKLTSAEAVEREKNLFARRASKGQTHARGYLAAYGASIIVLVTAAASGLFFVEVTGELAAIVGGALLMCFATGLSSMNHSGARASALDMMERIKPLANSAGCVRALDYVQAGHPAVIAWRDLAIAERGALHEFDVVVMRDLHFAAIEQDKAMAAQRENEEACRQLYGIA